MPRTYATNRIRVSPWNSIPFLLGCRVFARVSLQGHATLERIQAAGLASRPVQEEDCCKRTLVMRAFSYNQRSMGVGHLKPSIRGKQLTSANMPLQAAPNIALTIDDTILELLPTAVYVCNAEGIVVRYNRKAAEL